MRRRILEAAQSLFLRYGYSRVVMDDIVRELAISKKTIYNHFSSKADLLMAGIDQFVEDYQAKADAVLQDNSLSMPAKLNAYLRVVGESFAGTRQDFWTDLKRAEPEAWEKVSTFRRDILLKHFSQLLDEGAAAGYIRNDSSRHIALLMYIAAVQQLSDMDYLKQFPETMVAALPTSVAEQADQVISILLQGLLVQPEGKPSV